MAIHGRLEHGALHSALGALEAARDDHDAVAPAERVGMAHIGTVPNGHMAWQRPLVTSAP